MPKAIVEVEVTYEAGRNGEGTFTSLKVGDKPSIPLPPDAPAPRRLARDLLEAAMAPKVVAKPETPEGG